MITVFLGDYKYSYKGDVHCGCIENLITGQYVLLNTQNTQDCNKSDKHIHNMIDKYKDHLDKLKA